MGGDFDDDDTPPHLLASLLDPVEAFYDQAKSVTKLHKLASSEKERAIEMERRAWATERTALVEEIRMHEQANDILRKSLKEKKNGTP